jgi:hypothetical protein
LIENAPVLLGRREDYDEVVRRRSAGRVLQTANELIGLIGDGHQPVGDVLSGTDD